MRNLDGALGAARALAKRHNFLEQQCSDCRAGRVADGYPNPNTAMGFDEVPACPACEGYGIAFQVAPRTIWTASEVLARVSSSQL